jgi:hypothetical protein
VRPPSSSVPKPRLFQLHARFTPEGPDDEEQRGFLEFWIEANKCAQDLRTKKAARTKRRFQDLVAAERKTRHIMRKFIREEISADTAVKRIRRLVPNRRIARELLDHWSKVVTTKAEDLPRANEEIARKEADIHRRGQLINASEAILKGFSQLVESAMAGDAEAANDLVHSATAAVEFLTVVERAQPEVFHQIARQKLLWPMMARDEPGWEKIAADRIRGLDLGSGLRCFHAQFRQARGPDSSHPARRWAKAAVRVIETTFWRRISLSQLHRDFGSAEAFANFAVEAGWRFGDNAKWSDLLLGLQPFSRAALADWKKIIRQMIREERPEFHTAPEWSNQRNAAKASGRDSRGEIQCAILDDICSALARLAPE